MTSKRQFSKTSVASALALAVLATGILVSLAGAGNAKETTPAFDAEARAVAARVNGAPIYEDELAPLMKKAFRKYQKFGKQEPTPELSQVLRKRALEELISIELLYQAGKDLEIPDVEERVNAQFQRLRDRQGSAHQRGNETEWKESIRRNIYIQHYLTSAGVANPAIPEAEIRSYYEQNKESFKRQDTVHVRHILVQVAADAGPEDRARAREKVEKARREILEGKRFAQAAREYSEDNIARAGGDLGYIRRGYMPKEFDEVAFKLEKNQVSEVLETQYGYHVMEVLDKVPAGITPYEEIRDFLKKYLENELTQRRRDEVIQALRDAAQIEVLTN